MTFRYTCIPLFGILLLLANCVQIPQSAIDVNRQISKGITTLQDNGLQMVLAWEVTAYNFLDERFSIVYSKAENDFRKKRGLSASSALNQQQQMDVAGLAVLLRDKVRSKIHDEAEKMRRIISSNTKTTLEANESITNLLISADAVLTAQKSAIKEVGNLIPIPPEVTKFVKNAITVGLNI